MREGFDPYYKWLGIPPAEQPPNHYRLLGINLFETDEEVISNAADRQMAHVRMFDRGPQSGLSQEILNEIAAARVCLLRPDQRAEYDEALREQLRTPGGPASPPTPAAGHQQGPGRPPAQRRAEPTITARPPEPKPSWDEVFEGFDSGAEAPGEAVGPIEGEQSSRPIARCADCNEEIDAASEICPYCGLRNPVYYEDPTWGDEQGPKR